MARGQRKTLDEKIAAKQELIDALMTRVQSEAGTGGTCSGKEDEGAGSGQRPDRRHGAAAGGSG